MPGLALNFSALKSARHAKAYAGGFFQPTVRLGVTGLAHAGKTVFITSLVDNLLHSGRLPFFDLTAEGRLLRAYLEPQPDDLVPRFDYEAHRQVLMNPSPAWPEGTKGVSELRLTLEYQSMSAFWRHFGPTKLHIDIVDYPGEWLLDLPLLELSYEEWSREVLRQAGEDQRAEISREWLAFLATLRPQEKEEEAQAQQAATLFKAYLSASRSCNQTLSIVSPGRFLMPGDLQNSPALTFSPLIFPTAHKAPYGSLWAMMARRFEAYKNHIIKPFFEDHFSRLDRQIILVDALSVLNSGPQACQDLKRVLGEILRSFRPGKKTWLSSILARKTDRILFAATKADHLHHLSHDRLENILRVLVGEAMDRADVSGAKTQVTALASVRSTREGTARSNGESLPCIIGVPLKAEKLGADSFDGEKEIAIFPGDLPENADSAISGAWLREEEGRGEDDQNMRFIRFRPPKVLSNDRSKPATFPHIRLDRALNFLLGDRLK